MKQSDFDVYKTSNYTYREESTYKNVPIQLLEEFKRAFSDMSFRVRYRGPRMATRFDDGRYPDQCQRDCLKVRAEYFAVYDLKEKIVPNALNDLQKKYDELGRVNDNLHAINTEMANKIVELEEKLQADYILEIESNLDYARDKIFELEEALEHMQSIIKSVL